MDILFVALNPAEISEKNGKYFSRNRSFWNLLKNAELITEYIDDPKKGEDLVFDGTDINYNRATFGVTDLRRELVKTDSKQVSVEREHVNRILHILDIKRVKVACLMHGKVAEAFANAGVIPNHSGYGEVSKYRDTMIFNMPFHNASILNKPSLYRMIKNYLNSGDPSCSKTSDG
jgi:hypothetical protein